MCYRAGAFLGSAIVMIVAIIKGIPTIITRRLLLQLCLLYCSAGSSGLIPSRGGGHTSCFGICCFCEAIHAFCIGGELNSWLLLLLL